MAETTAITLKLLVDTKGQRVLFAEACKDFVDFLFYILSLPVATVIGLLKKQQTVGSLTKLFESIENLNESYIQPGQNKTTLLKPVAPRICASSSVPLLALNESPPVKKFYRCTQCVSYISDNLNAVCPSCARKMERELTYVAPPPAAAGEDGGYVKGVVTYMVMDDLTVMPLSTISSITLLNKFNVKDVSDLEEKVVNFGMDEAVKLLNASLQSKEVFTDVFLK